jgi:hypothetical protein
MTLSFTTLCSDSSYAKCRYVECRYAECYYSGNLGAYYITMSCFIWLDSNLI